MRVVLHIGTDKTGSSSIQQHLARNNEWLFNRGIYTPQTLNVTKGHSHLLERSKPPFWALQVHLGNAYLRGSSTFLVSWEGMNFYTAEQIRELSAHLGDNDIEILVYLREQSDILQTGLLQHIKSLSNEIRLHRLVKPLALWDKDLRDWLISNVRDYHSMLQTWRAEIPQAKFRIRIYEKSKLVQGNAVDDLVAQLGLAPDENFRRIENLANPSLDVESALLVDKWQEQCLTKEHLSHCIDVVQSLVASQSGGTRYFLDRQAVAAIRKAAQRSNRLLSKNFLGKKNTLFSLDNPCSRDDAVEDLEQRITLLEKEVNRYDEYPSMRPTKSDESIHTQLRLVEGWREAEHKSVRSIGAESRIRFRMFSRHLYHTASGIRILLRAHYHYGSRQTAIEINGRDYGMYNLEENLPGFDLPFDELRPCDTVDIVLRHGPIGLGDGQSILELRKVGFHPIPRLASSSS